MVTTGAVASTVQVCDCSADSLPARSTAFTFSVCWPSARGGSGSNVDPQLPKPLPRSHWNDPPSGSFDENVNSGVRSLLSAGGLLLIWAVGAVVSTVQVTESGVPS